MPNTIDSIRSRTFVLLTLIGLVALSMPPALGDCCDVQQAPPACADDPVHAESCCTSEGGPVQQSTDHDDDCCGNGCSCLCCAPLTPLVGVRIVPLKDSIVQSAAMAAPRLTFRPQDAVGALLHPPRT